MTSPRTPEARAALWKRLAALASAIRDDETRAQYLASWRARFDREVSAVGELSGGVEPLHAQIAALDGDYAWPEDQGESERRLIMGIRRLIELRAERAEISQTIRDGMAVMKAAGFDPKAINATIRDIEADSECREDHEALWALYRRVMGVKGPMTEAILPSPIDARQARITNAVQRRLSKAMVLIDARDVGVADG